MLKSYTTSLLYYSSSSCYMYILIAYGPLSWNSCGNGDGLKQEHSNTAQTV